MSKKPTVVKTNLAFDKILTKIADTKYTAPKKQTEQVKKG